MRRTPSGRTLLGGKLVRCSVCNSPLDPMRTPHGGQFVANATTTSINGTDVTVASTGGGCWFCQSLNWRKGRAGDLNKIW